mgnify:FL=1
MDITHHMARVIGPVAYRSITGHTQTVPISPCLIERLAGSSVDVIWGASAQSSAVIPMEDIDEARAFGFLVLLD